MTFLEEFDEGTETERAVVEVGGGDEEEKEVVEVKVLEPRALLNAKCRALLGRASEAKKSSDADEVKFLLHFLAERKSEFPVTQRSVPNVTKDFVKWFAATYGEGRLWRGVGFDRLKGMLGFCPRWCTCCTLADLVYACLYLKESLQENVSTRIESTKLKTRTSDKNSPGGKSRDSLSFPLLFSS